jgi:hypothetical protein
MSYATRVRGAFEIEPPIRWSEIKDSPFKFHHASSPGEIATWRAPGIDLDLMVDTREQDHEDGESIIRTYAGVRLVMREIDEYRADSLVGQVQRVIEMFDDDHTFTGVLDAEGEGGGWGPDVWRCEIIAGKAQKTVAVLMYPDEILAERADMLTEIADHFANLAPDSELDPGRNECIAYLRGLVATRNEINKRTRGDS